jgi:hypothetical protein
MPLSCAHYATSRWNCKVREDIGGYASEMARDRGLMPPHPSTALLTWNRQLLILNLARNGLSAVDWYLTPAAE